MCKIVIKACPLCGNLSLKVVPFIPMNGKGFYYKIQCICGLTLKRRTKDEVIKDWNERK